CVGSFDECGVCNGPGAIYECGCADIPEGDCDCDGNVLDALGVCGGDCAADADSDGVCDDVDDCVDLDGTNCGIGGCMDPENPAYDPTATYEDGSCLIGGCMIEAACNYNPEAEYQMSGACEFTSCAGCMDSVACNYDSDATIESNNCVYPEAFYDCAGSCLSDSDGDGVCDELEVYGCTNIDAINYNPNATEEDDSCLTSGCLIPFACNYDPTADYIDIDLCDFNTCVGCMDEEACNFDSEATLPSSALCEYPIIYFLDCNGDCINDADGDGVCDEQEILGCTNPVAVNFNPYATEDNGSCIILTGGCVIPFACNYDPGSDYYLPGSCDFSCLFGDPSGMIDSDCMDQNACNYGADGSCQYFDIHGELCILGGCTLADACNYDSEAEYNDGSCDYSCTTVGLEGQTLGNNIEVVNGCTNPAACNFNTLANQDNGQCEFSSCYSLGCTDSSAINFNENATMNDGSCEYPVVPIGVGGCTDANAINFDSNATMNNGTCLYDIYGCTNDMACNFDYRATVDNGNCEYVSCYGCMSKRACNYNAYATHFTNCDFVLPRTINGNTNPKIGEEVIYTYPLTIGSDYSWSINGGHIISANRNEVSVFWTSKEGAITVVETNSNGCEGPEVVMHLERTNAIEVRFTMYPNPAVDEFTLNIDSETAYVQIIDVMGRVLVSTQVFEGANSIDVSEMAFGTYKVVVMTEVTQSFETLVIGK
ncbi:MAG: hypothetical protein CL847_02375, partial [Crocinitomicaceae bacterium]|nr:hypothetical protein [Crocinitomicaceae bacterium]